MFFIESILFVNTFNLIHTLFLTRTGDGKTGSRFLRKRVPKSTTTRDAIEKASGGERRSGKEGTA
jgi:uncharacterized protein YndB with AHSA1/START domain